MDNQPQPNTVTTKFKVGDKIYFIQGIKICYGEISKVTVHIFALTMQTHYQIMSHNNEKHESEVFATKNELIEHLVLD